MINKKYCLLFITWCLSSHIYGQDLISRKAPIDRKLKLIDSIALDKKQKESSTVSYSKQGDIIVIDKKDNWEWLQTEKYEYKSDSYPYKVSYLKYPSHPNLKIIDGGVFDSKGNLLRIDIPLSDDGKYLNDEIYKELIRYKSIIDYRNNKYNFKKENARAHNYVKIVLGLVPFPGGEFSKYWSEAGGNYLDQLENDHEFDFRKLVKIERLTNLSFKILFDVNKKQLSAYKVVYQSLGGFKCKINITTLAPEQIDWSQYETSKSIEDDNDGMDGVSQYESKERLYLHKVKKGETLQSIARKRQITVDALCRLNHIGKNVQLKPGQILKYDYGEPSYELSSPMISVLEDNQTKTHNKAVDKVSSYEGAISTEVESVDTMKIYHASEIDEPPRFPKSVVDNKKADAENVFEVVDKMPEFPGGSGAFMQYLSTSVKYPVVAEENGVQGRVICSFIVEPDGSISEVKVVKSVDPSLDKEAQRVISSMPKWIPGKKNGSPVRVKYTTPVTFRLQ